MVSKELILKHGAINRGFKMIVISNSKFTESEFANWWKICEKDKVQIPSRGKIQKLELKLKKVKNHTNSSSEVNKIIELNIAQQISKGDDNINITYLKTQLESQFSIAKKTLEDNPSPEAQDIFDNLKTNLDKLE